MKLPTKTGWYWVQIPGVGKEVVRIIISKYHDGADFFAAQRVGIPSQYPITISMRGWRWLGRAVLEKK